MSETNEKAMARGTVGCVGGVINLFMEAPLWLAMVYLILDKIDAGPVLWTLFYIYGPIKILSAIFVSIFKAMSDDTNRKKAA